MIQKAIYKIWDKNYKRYIGSTRRSQWTKFPTLALSYVYSDPKDLEVHKFPIIVQDKIVLDPITKCVI